MYILGINAHHADASACLFDDDRLIAATEEERFTRVKHWAGFPRQAIEFCLQEAGISIREVDHIAVGRDPKAKLMKKVLYQLRQARGWSGAFERLRNTSQMLSIRQELAQAFGISPEQIKGRIHHIEHHLSHMASAFFASPFEEAAILSIDGSGDFTTTMIGVGRGNRIEALGSVDFPVSTGSFYTAFTQYLGFPYYGDEYKVMGLAPYGEPVYMDVMHDIIHLLPDGLYTWNPRYFRSTGQGAIMYFENNLPVIPRLYSDYLVSRFGPPRYKDEPLEQRHRDIAASVQKMTEEIIFHVLNHLHKRTGLKNLCVAGGVAQNSVANGKITDFTGFERVYVPSAGHDAGTSMGAALYVYHQVLGRPRRAPILSAFTGFSARNGHIKSLLESHGLEYQEIADEEVLIEKVVDKLIEPGVVGWYHGRAEFGPRALGARSILADPRNAQAKKLLNAKIKKRESFRPFAPSILKEYTAEYFTKVDEVPFMEKVFPIRPGKRPLIPAVTHVDGTGRLQTVDKQIAPRYYKLIEAFRRRTGIPLLLNTSFNENEPIVNKPEEALDCYLRTDMDMLVLENFVVERKNYGR
ncbi:MAG: carbamoyltransferase [Methanobacteriota archaeon]|nr:MAG: carbamoyltransferase [Euryarchaeota archaeon]